MKHVVHCSGYSLAERFASGATNRDAEPIGGTFRDWEHVCIGDPRLGVLGRIPMTLRILRTVNAEWCIWSTGATFAEGTSEADVMMQSALALLSAQNESTDALRRISVIDTDSINTTTSMIVAARLVLERFGNEELMLHLVTSANHAPRVLRDAAVALESCPNVIISAVPCHTSYGQGAPSEVSIKDLRR